MITVEDFINEKISWFEERLSKTVERIGLQSYVATYSVQGGKRLRPCLCLLVHEALDGKNLDRCWDYAVGIELLHQATLLHDDIIDVDLTRRKKATAWKEFDTKKALLTGDKLMQFALYMLQKHGFEEMGLMAECFGDLVDGVFEEINEGAPQSKVAYLRRIKLKTGSLFGLACRLGSAAAEAPKKIQENFRDYGTDVGIAYQIADDIVDGEIKEEEWQKDMNDYCIHAKLNIASLKLKEPFDSLLYKVPDYVTKAMLKELWQ